MSNIFKTAILLAVLTAMLVFIGGAIGGQQGMLVAFVLATAHLFIVNPLAGGALTRLFSTHPPLEERVARLRAMRA